jgi:hypothetical protein
MLICYGGKNLINARASDIASMANCSQSRTQVPAAWLSPQQPGTLGPNWEINMGRTMTAAS